MNGAPPPDLPPSEPPPPEPPGGGDPDAGGPDAIGEPIGPFPTWTSLYATVLVWWAFMVVLLYVFTVVFDRGVT